MNRLNSSVLLMAMTFAAVSNAATTEVSTANLQQAAKRPYNVQNADHQADQAWEGATLQTTSAPEVQHAENRKVHFEQQVNLQYASKRAFIQPQSK